MASTRSKRTPKHTEKYNDFCCEVVHKMNCTKKGFLSMLNLYEKSSNGLRQKEMKLKSRMPKNGYSHKKVYDFEGFENEKGSPSSTRLNIMKRRVPMDYSNSVGFRGSPKRNINTSDHSKLPVSQLSGESFMIGPSPVIPKKFPDSKTLARTYLLKPRIGKMASLSTYNSGFNDFNSCGSTTLPTNGIINNSKQLPNKNNTTTEKYKKILSKLDKSEIVIIPIKRTYRRSIFPKKQATKTVKRINNDHHLTDSEPEVVRAPNNLCKKSSEEFCVKNNNPVEYISSRKRRWDDVHIPSDKLQSNSKRLVVPDIHSTSDIFANNAYRSKCTENISKKAHDNISHLKNKPNKRHVRKSIRSNKSPSVIKTDSCIENCNCTFDQYNIECLKRVKVIGNVAEPSKKLFTLESIDSTLPTAISSMKQQNVKIPINTSNCEKFRNSMKTFLEAGTQMLELFSNTLQQQHEKFLESSSQVDNSCKNLVSNLAKLGEKIELEEMESIIDSFDREQEDRQVYKDCLVKNMTFSHQAHKSLYKQMAELLKTL